jgi:hypothetical protein
MFQPTHILSSRSKQIPVCLVRHAKGVSIFTEQEWQQQRQQSAFEFRPKLGFFCHGIAVTGYALEAIAVKAEPNTTSSQSYAEIRSS